MKRKASISLLVAMLLLVGCQSSDNDQDTTNNQYDGLDGYYDDAGFFWLNDGSGYYNSDGDYIETQVDSDEDETPTQVDDSFISSVVGSYLDVDTGLEQCSLVLESNGEMTFIYNAVTHTANIMGEYLTDGYLLENITFIGDDGYQYGWNITFSFDDNSVQVNKFPVMKLQ